VASVAAARRTPTARTGSPPARCRGQAHRSLDRSGATIPARQDDDDDDKDFT
jgi:hypothetical protein